MENVKNLGKVCLTPEGEWNVNKEYDRLALVVGEDIESGELMTFISKKHVPPGVINLGDEEYWQKFTNKVHFEDITLRDDGWIYIGDEPVYQVTLHDAIGQAVVDKIEEGLTNKIMAAITTYMTNTIDDLKLYMNNVVASFIEAITDQVTRLVTDGINVNNKLSGTVNETLSGTVNTPLSGQVRQQLEGTVNENVTHEGNVNLSGKVKTEQSGELLNKVTGGLGVAGTVDGSMKVDNTGKLGVEHEGTIQNINSGSLNSNVALSGGITVDDGQPTPPVTHKVTVNVNPNTAKVTIDGVETRTKDIVEGSTVLIVASLEGYETKTHTVSNLSEDTTITLTLVQKQVNYIFAVQPLTNYVPAAGGAISALVISLKDSAAQDYTYSKRGDDIIDSISKMESNLVINVKANSVTNSKVAYVDLIQNDSNKNLTIVINQAGLESTDVYVFDSNKNSVNAPSAGSTESVTITSTKNGVALGYTIRTTPAWATVTKDAQNNLSIQIPENTSTADRTGIIEIIQDESHISKIINVTQQGKADDYVFSAQSTALNVAYGGGSAGTNVTSKKNNVDQSYDVITTLPSWITLESKTSSAISFAVAANTNPASRSQAIVLKQAESNNEITITITQAAAPDNYVFQLVNSGQSQINVTEDSHNINISVTSTKNGNAQTYSKNSTPSWCNVNIVSGGIYVQISENTGAARNTNIVLTQAESGNTIVIAVSQAEKQEDTFVFETPVSMTLRSEGGANTANCTSTKNGAGIGLTVLSKPSWVTNVDFNTSTQKLTVTASENTEYNDRNGSIVLKQNESNTEKTINVTQESNHTVTIEGMRYDKVTGDSGMPFNISSEGSLVTLYGSQTFWQTRLEFNNKLDGNDIYTGIRVEYVPETSVDESWATVYSEVRDILRIERNGNTPNQTFNLKYKVYLDIHKTTATSSEIVKTVSFDLDWNWEASI